MAVNRTLAVTGALLVPLTLTASEPVYRSVDEQGRVSYSDEPPASSVETEEMLFKPGPTPAQVEQARRRQQDQLELADKLYQQRLQQQEARREAQQEQRYATPVYPQREYDDNYFYPYPYRYGYGYRPRYPHHPVAPGPRPPVEPPPLIKSTPALLPKSKR